MKLGRGEHLYQANWCHHQHGGALRWGDQERARGTKEASAVLGSKEGVWGTGQAFLPLGDQVICRGECWCPELAGDDRSQTQKSGQAQRIQDTPMQAHRGANLNVHL